MSHLSFQFLDFHTWNLKKLYIRFDHNILYGYPLPKFQIHLRQVSLFPEYISESLHQISLCYALLQFALMKTSYLLLLQVLIFSWFRSGCTTFMYMSCGVFRHGPLKVQNYAGKSERIFQLCEDKLLLVHIVLSYFYSTFNSIDSPSALGIRTKLDKRISSPFSIRDIYGLLLSDFIC